MRHVPLFVSLLAFLAACGDDSGPDQAAAMEAPAAGPNVPWPPYVILGRRADPEDITWTLDPKGSAVTPERFEEAVRTALASWQQTGCVRFRQVEDAQEADVVFSWHGENHRECAFLSWDGGVAHSAARGDRAFVHFRTNVDWDGAPPDGCSLDVAALHEIGHVLGLGHSPRRDALMYGGYDRSHDRLQEPDLQALHTLYGGGGDGPNDLHVVTFDTEGRPTAASAPLRGVAPSFVQVATAETDSQPGAEVLLWRRDRHIGPLFGFRFLPGLQVEKSIGPVPGITRPDRATLLGHDHNARPWMVHVNNASRWVAVGFDEKGLPTDRFAGSRLELDHGLVDQDGDGLIDSPGPHRTVLPDGREVWARADVDGDGKADVLAASAAPDPQDPRDFQWLFTRGHPEPSIGGAIFRACAVAVADLDGDGRIEGVATGWDGK